MENITNINTLSPLIRQSFNAALLSTPMILFRENSQVLLKIWNIIKKKIVKRISYRISDAEFDHLIKLEKEFKEKYEWITKKEEELKAETRHRTQKLFYYFTMPSKSDGLIYQRLKYKRSI